MGKQEQNEEIQQIHTNSGHVFVESTNGSSSSESEGEMSPANVEDVEYMTHSEDDHEQEEEDEVEDEGEHVDEEHRDVEAEEDVAEAIAEDVQYMTHSEDEDEEDEYEGDVTAPEEEQEEEGTWRCHYYPNCKEVFECGQDWAYHKESTCPFRESERVPQESQDVNPPLPETPRRTDFTQDFEISDDEEEDQEDKEEGEREDRGEEKQRYKCHNTDCPESFQDNKDLFYHELICEFRVSEGESEFDQEENPPSSDPSLPSDLMQDSSLSSFFNLSPASSSGDLSQVQPIQEQEQPIQEQEQRTDSRAAHTQQDEHKMKLPQCGACGEILHGTREELLNHTCSEAKCQFCEYKLKNLADLKEHYEEKHNKETKFKCPYCGHELDQLDESCNINEHLKSKYCGKGKSYKCKYCEEIVIFRFKKYYIRHASQYHDRGFQCCICHEIFNEINLYKSHSGKHRRKNIFQCPYCDELLNPDSGTQFLRRHVKKHVSERSQLFKKGETPKTYQCPKCPKEYVSEAFLRSHGKRIHGIEQILKCSECSMEFTNSNKAEAHFKEKHEKGQLPRKDRKHSTNCGACGEILQNTQEVWNNHNCSEAECQFCEYKFNNFSDFVQHYEKNHDNEIKFVCPYCGVRLNKSSEFSIEEQHSRSKNCGKGHYYKCKKCEETVIFKLDKDFKEHDSQYHLNGFQCYICRKIFKYADFKLHSHATPEIFKCAYCGTTFTPFNVRALHQHFRGHAKERSAIFEKGKTPKTYQCPECQKDYVTEVFLTNHGIQKHGTEYLFKCSECDMEFSTEREADSHFTENHDDPEQGMIMPQCGVCGEILPGTLEELNNHTCSVAQCQFCEYKLKDFADLILHYEQNHNNETIFECPYCDYPPNNLEEFNYINLKEHFQSRNCPKGNYYKCKNCQEMVIFKLKKDYKEHESQYHFRGYQCCICREIIHAFSDYKSHGRDIHQNSSIFKCPYCWKLVPVLTGRYLQDHVKKHERKRSELFKEGKTPKTFSCPKCKKEFVFEHFLKSHGKQKHGTENLFDCTECGMGFPTSNDADAHFEKEHSELKRRREREGPDKNETPHPKKPRSLHE